MIQKGLKPENRKTERILKETFAYIFLCVLLFMLSAIPVSAYQMLFRFDSNLEVTEMSAFSENKFYENKFYSGSEDTTGIPVMLYDSGSNIVSSSTIQGNGIAILTLPGFAEQYSMKVGFAASSASASSSSSGQISFCNNNNICEPCLTGFCTLAENYLSCPADCSSGGNDGFCDLKKDSVCDPDCYNLDIDCPNCTGRCFSGGNGCLAYELCDGSSIYSDDFGTKCCKGDCFDPNKNQNDAILKKILRKESAARESEVSDDIFQETQESPYDEESQDYYGGSNTSYNIMIVFASVIVVIIVMITVTMYLHKDNRKELSNPVVRYVDGMLQKGYTKEQISAYMRQYNYKPQDVDWVFRMLKR
jgi:hypothetical protein